MLSAVESPERAVVREGGLDEAMESFLDADGDRGADTWDGVTNGCAVSGVVGRGA